MGCCLIFLINFRLPSFCPQIHSLSCTGKVHDRYLPVTFFGARDAAANETKQLLSLSLLSRQMKGQFAWNLKIADGMVVWVTIISEQDWGAGALVFQAEASGPSFQSRRPLRSKWPTVFRRACAWDFLLNCQGYSSGRRPPMKNGPVQACWL